MRQAPAGARDRTHLHDQLMHHTALRRDEIFTHSTASEMSGLRLAWLGVRFGDRLRRSDACDQTRTQIGATLATGALGSDDPIVHAQRSMELARIQPFTEIERGDGRPQVIVAR